MRFKGRLAMFLFAALLPLHGQVRVWEGTMPLAASDEGPPDENPPFDIFQTTKFSYPYTLRENVRKTETMHDWRAVYLENEYLKCTVLPDMGGHIYTCVDKVNGTPMFYANPSFKKALIGYRGAWNAFGVEFNFPVSHNWVSVSPVDWSYSTAPDGSASVTVGNRDRVYGMEWTVQLVLRPASTVLEERVSLVNSSDLRHRFYWWNNAGVQIWNDSRICYPMQFTASHGFKDVDTWPVNSTGKDMSLISNQTDGPVSRFVHGSREPFMGIYNPHTDAGVVHYAEYRDLPAKKIWSWGVDADGLAWRKALSDNESAYAEVQAGLLRNQETYAFLQPRQAIRFSEFWMPVRGIGGISRANLNGVVSLSRTTLADGKISLSAALNANRRIPDAEIEILNGDKVLFTQTTALDPAKTWSHRLDGLSADAKYTFLLKTGKQTLLEHTEGVYDWTPRDQVQTGPQAAYQPPAKERWSDGDYLEEGTNEELQGDLISAWQTYEAGLAKFPDSFDLLKASGRLAVNLLRFEEAARRLAAVEARATWDAEIHYYRGIAEAALNQPAEARTEYEAAYRAPSYKTAGGLLLAEWLAQDHESVGALKVLAEACRQSSGDRRCVEETVALRRSSGDMAAAKTLAQAALKDYPTSAFLQNELGIMGSPAPELNHHLAADSSRILDLVAQYNRLGLYANSVELLSRAYPTVPPEQREPGVPSPASDPLLAYYRGYCRQRLGQSGEQDFAAASRMPLRYVFPARAETIPVLRAALAVNPSDASAHFLLGTLWFSRGIVDPAIEEWQRADSLNPNIPALHASLGLALISLKKQPVAAAAVFQKGFAADANNPALYIGMDRAMRQMGDPASRRVAMMKRFPDSANMPADFVRALDADLREDGQDAQADALLKEHFLPRKEGAAPLLPKSATDSSPTSKK
jgi:tetratricopeptide (TPR) repeat protein